MGEDALKLAAVTMLVMLAACRAEKDRPLGVHETIKDIHALNGKTVRVAGYLGECGGYDCGLFENKTEWQQADRYFTTLRATHKLPASEFPDWLGIGAGELICPRPAARSGCYSEVDKKAAPYTNSYVLITGKVSDSCRDEQGRPGCTDRAPELEPLVIAAWTPSKGAS